MKRLGDFVRGDTLINKSGATAVYVFLDKRPALPGEENTVTQVVPINEGVEYEVGTESTIVRWLVNCPRASIMGVMEFCYLVGDGHTIDDDTWVLI